MYLFVSSNDPYIITQTEQKAVLDTATTGYNALNFIHPVVDLIPYVDSNNPANNRWIIASYDGSDFRVHITDGSDRILKVFSTRMGQYGRRARLSIYENLLLINTQLQVDSDNSGTFKTDTAICYLNDGIEYEVEGRVNKTHYLGGELTYRNDNIMFKTMNAGETYDDRVNITETLPNSCFAIYRCDDNQLRSIRAYVGNRQWDGKNCILLTATNVYTGSNRGGNCEDVYLEQVDILPTVRQVSGIPDLVVDEVLSIVDNGHYIYMTVGSIVPEAVNRNYWNSMCLYVIVFDRNIILTVPNSILAVIDGSKYSDNTRRSFTKKTHRDRNNYVFGINYLEYEYSNNRYRDRIYVTDYSSMQIYTSISTTDTDMIGAVEFHGYNDISRGDLHNNPDMMTLFESARLLSTYTDRFVSIQSYDDQLHAIESDTGTNKPARNNSWNEGSINSNKPRLLYVGIKVPASISIPVFDYPSYIDLVSDESTGGPGGF